MKMIIRAKIDFISKWNAEKDKDTAQAWDTHYISLVNQVCRATVVLRSRKR